MVFFIGVTFKYVKKLKCSDCESCTVKICYSQERNELIPKKKMKVLPKKQYLVIESK